VFGGGDQVENVQGLINSDYCSHVDSFNFRGLGPWLSQDQETKSELQQGPEPIENSSEPTCDDESQKPEELTETNVTEPMEEQLEEVETENISFPTSIRVVGYDSKLNYLYINYSLTTTKTVSSSERIVFNYVVEIFNGNDVLIGSIGSFDSPEQEIGMLGQNSLDIRDRRINIRTDKLPAAYRIVITVTETYVI